MKGDIYPREFLNPAPPNILFEDMLANDQPNNNNRLEKGIIRIPSLDGASNNSSLDNCYYEYNSATTDNTLSQPSLNINIPSPQTPSTRKQSQADNPPPPPDAILRNLNHDADTDTGTRSRPPRAAKSKALEILQARHDTLPADAREISFRQLSNVQLRIARSTIETTGTGLFLLQRPHLDGSARAGSILGTYDGVRHTDPNKIEWLRSPQVESDYLFKATDPHTGTTAIIDASASFSCYGRYANDGLEKGETAICVVTHHNRTWHGTGFYLRPGFLVRNFSI